jgi:hypothetical protein
MRTLSGILTSEGAEVFNRAYHAVITDGVLHNEILPPVKDSFLIIIRSYLRDWEHITKCGFYNTQLLSDTFCVVAKKTLELFTFMTLALKTKPRPTPTRSAFQVKLPLPVFLVQAQQFFLRFCLTADYAAS